MGAAEDVALYGLRTSLGSILENFGFGTVNEDSVDLLSDIMRKFITNVATKSKFYAEHAGRTDAACKDIALAFRKIHFSTSELCDFAHQNNFPPPKAFPKFPVVKPNPRPLYHPQPSEKELETRPEYIPEFLQAAHPEWTKEGADYLAVMKPSTSADKKGAAPDFPSFEGCSAKEMGLRKEDRKPPPPVITRTDDSSATGIRSSANIASQRLYNPDYAAQLNKKKNKPLSALKEGGSRSTTPIGRTNSPFEPGSEDRSRTDSPSTSKSAEKQKFKPRPPSSASRALFELKPNEPSTSAASADGGYDEAAQSPMPRLEQEEQIAGEASLSIPPIEYDESFETPPRIDENLINANILLFQQLKQQQEREAKDKMEKERQKEARQKKKDEQKEKKKEAAKLKEEQKKELDAAKKLAKEEEKKRKKAEKARLAAEAKTKAKEALKLEAERKLVEAFRAQTSTPIQSVYTPSITDEGEQKPLKLLITNPLSSNASSTFSPSPIRAPPSLREVTPAPSIIQTNDDEDTIPFYADTSTGGDTTFPMDISMTSTEAATPKKDKKKKHKKDKHRDSSPSSHKKHKKDKEHKKHKKDKREREEKDKDREHKHKHKESKEAKEVKEDKQAEPEQKPLTLKIRLGDQTPSNNDYTPYQQQQHEPVRLKFKFSSDKKEEEKVPPLRLGMPSVPKDRPTSAEKVKPPKPEKTKSPYDKEKEEKQKRREERKRREREEAEERQKTELERLKREHELKQKREAEEKKRHDDFIREREERERKKEKEREQKLKMEKELALINATTECLFSKKEKEKFKIDKYEKEKEKEKKKEAPAPPPPVPPAPAPVMAPGPGPGHDGDDDDETLWICPSCHVAWTEGANMVACDICNDWFHWHCVGLLVAPEDDIPWFCKKCSRKPLKRPSKSVDSPKKKKKYDSPAVF